MIRNTTVFFSDVVVVGGVLTRKKAGSLGLCVYAFLYSFSFIQPSLIKS